MKQLAQSVGSFMWAMPLFGMQQMANAVRKSEDGVYGGDAIRAMDQITRMSLDCCGDSAKNIFETGDRLQRGMFDMTFRIIPGSGGMTGEGCDCDGMCGEGCDCHQEHHAMGAGFPPMQSHAPAEEELGWGPVPPVS